MQVEDVTFIVKSFERFHCLDRLIASLRRYYPDVRVIVADDSRQAPPPSKDYELLRLPFDSGLSAGRNAMLEMVTTKWFLLLDDDFVFTSATDVGLLRAAAEHGHDVVGGAVIEKGKVRRYEGVLRRDGDTLRYDRSFLADHGDHQTCDMVMNFFLGRTEAVKKVRWDPRLKLAEHSDFFWRAKGVLSVAYRGDVSIGHLREREGEYRKYRMRAKKLFRIFLRKNGFARSVNFEGVVYKA